LKKTDIDRELKGVIEAGRARPRTVSRAGGGLRLDRVAALMLGKRNLDKIITPIPIFISFKNL
jgi:hypothetical protein